ncbi:hypothetical protein AB6A40_011358 [Gnathostoma spinigerum]|uniref:Uncharacterized protein n=1 Tax=Gnathostoma spinigerum TaxID=75299 RepID=A0ABD6F384_9BILA
MHIIRVIELHSEEHRLRALVFLQFTTIILCFLTFADVYRRLWLYESECQFGDNTQSVIIRSRRSPIVQTTRSRLFPTKNSTSESDVWIHSLSKIKVNELLTKCFEIHEYCTDKASTDRGPPGPVGPPGQPGYAV